MLLPTVHQTTVFWTWVLIKWQPIPPMSWVGDHGYSAIARVGDQSSCRRQREYRREELVICCARFDLVEKITLLAYISMLQMWIEQEVMEGQ